MSDDLVKRLRGFPPNIHETMTEAADRIAELEAALLNLIEHTLDCEIELNKLHGLGAGTSSVLCESHAALEGGKS